MLKRCMMVLALALLQGEATATVNITDPYPAWRATAANVLATHSDANSLASAAALTFLGSPSRSKAETGKASSAALALGRKAGELAPDNSAISWLYLQLCTNTPGCDIRDAATTMRWVAADNSVAWLPTLASAQKDKDSTEADRVLESMAQTEHFDLYGNRATLLIFDALRRARHELPGHYLASDAARLNEAMGIANAALVPSFSPIINACREAAPGAERRDSCLTLSKTMQRADSVMAQLVGYAIEKRLTPADAKGQRVLAEHRRVLEWRVATAARVDTAQELVLKSSYARWRVAMMRTRPREEDLCIAILRKYNKALVPPEDYR